MSVCFYHLPNTTRMGWKELSYKCELIPVTTAIRAKFSVSKNSAPRAPITLGITLGFVFHIRDIFNARSWYFNILSATLSLTQKSKSIAATIMNVFRVLLSMSPISRPLASITRSVLIPKDLRVLIFLSSPLLCVHTSVWQVPIHTCY